MNTTDLYYNENDNPVLSQPFKHILGETLFPKVVDYNLCKILTDFGYVVGLKIWSKHPNLFTANEWHWVFMNWVNIDLFFEDHIHNPDKGILYPLTLEEVLKFYEQQHNYIL